MEEQANPNPPPQVHNKKLPVQIVMGIIAASFTLLGFTAGYFFPKAPIQPLARVTSEVPSSPAHEIPVQARAHIPVCISHGPREPRCHAQVVVGQNGKPSTSGSPTAYSPTQFQSAYGLGGSSSSGRIVAIVDAFDHPNIKSDLDTYSTNFGLPILPTCSGTISESSVPCFQKVDQRGGTAYPTADSSWSIEIALDVETVHGACPDCKILLVEADVNTYDNLLAAVDRAVLMGANVVSNSYGSAEFSSETAYDAHFNVPGVAFTFSSGDSGYGATYPAASRFVTAVGGTTLALASNNLYKSETAWKGAGSGCSSFETKPSVQKDIGCQMRTIADVSADADPSSGASIYSSVSYQGQTGWFIVGGTSLASPLVASTYALKGVPSGVVANTLPYLNSPGVNLHDVTSGSNGVCDRKNKYLCNAQVGYDGPTGLGTPKGINGF